MATRTPSSRSRSTTAKTAPRKRTTRSAASSRTSSSLTEEAKTAVRSVRARASRAANKVPTDRTSLSIAAGVIAGLVAAGVTIFMNRDKLRSVATTGGEKLKKAADDLSTIAHERIDQARDNITKFRARAHDVSDADEQSATPPAAMNS